MRVRVTPRAAREAIDARDGVLHVRVTAPAAEGRANQALRRALAGALGIAPSLIAIDRGARGREKLVLVPDAARERLATLLSGPRGRGPCARSAIRARRAAPRKSSPGQGT